uniref:hypothetical protein n=1 Tax=Amycolatopsis sp. cmx-4-83 TaxID=2790940 RepID=UPI0039784D96
FYNVKFRNKVNAKLMRWYKKERKEDKMLRYFVDGVQWRLIDRELLEFEGDVRNIRFGLSTDGFNLFGELSSGYSIWFVIFCMFNFFFWLCMK